MGKFVLESLKAIGGVNYKGDDHGVEHHDELEARCGKATYNVLEHLADAENVEEH